MSERAVAMIVSNWALLAGMVAGFMVAGCAVGTGGTSRSGAGAGLKVSRLRCEYREQPLGIGVTQPRFSWILESNDPARRGQKQQAYQVLVSSTKAGAEAGKGDLWDTGRVASDLTAQLPYAGQPLVSGQECWWTVRVWDGDGQPSSWAPVQRFSLGLLQPQDWKTAWVGYDAPYTPLPQDPAEKIDGLKWVWSAQSPTGPAAKAFFRKSFELPARHIRRAFLAMSATDAVTAALNGHVVVQGTERRVVYVQNANWMLKAGRNLLTIEAQANPGEPAIAGKLVVEFDTGEPLLFPIDSSWHAAADAQDGWKAPEFDDSRWPAPKEVATVGQGRWATTGVKEMVLPPAPYLRGEFDMPGKQVKRATAYATALGLYRLFLNGQRVGNIELAPGWEDYRHRVYYNTYDVTSLLRHGRNALGVMLGDGWYDGYVGYTFKRHNYGGDPRARVQINIEFTDGTSQTVGTAPDWKATYGPVREADLLMGCTYDAREEKAVAGFDQPGFTDSQWAPVVTGVNGPSASSLLQPYNGDPTVRHELLKARAVTEPLPGVYVFDLGQNMVGWAHFRLKLKAGQHLTFRYAEMLNPDGTLYTTALRAARVIDSYTAARDGVVDWEPVFTFHGFRYVEISGLDRRPDPDAVTGIVIHADMSRSGTFECSNPLVNQLVHNIVWGQKGNYLEVPTDCPQRDERLGWTGDAQFFVNTGAYNFDTAAFFNKWLVDLVEDSQTSFGGFTHVAPALAPEEGGATAWQDAAVICTYAMYKYYGDTRNIEQHWPHLQRYMQYLHDTSHDLVRNDKPFGDWLNKGASAKSEVTGTAYYAYVARLMSEMAGAIGHTQEQQEYAQLADRIKAKFIQDFVRPDGTILESSQTGFALAFTMDLLPADVRAKAAQHFTDEVRNRDWHLGTGFIGTPRLLPGLQLAGQTDTAYRLLLQDTYPSWLFQVKLGATTMWERWDGYRPDAGFQDPGMNSFNHYAFGSVGEWIWSAVAGISQQDTAFRHIVIQPHPGGNLTFAKGRYDSINGPIVSEWGIQGGKIRMHVEIPANTTATVYVPVTGAVTESGRPAESAPGVKFLRQDGNAMVYEVGSGRYDFASTWNQ